MIRFVAVVFCVVLIVNLQFCPVSSDESNPTTSDSPNIDNDRIFADLVGDDYDDDDDGGGGLTGGSSELTNGIGDGGDDSTNQGPGNSDTSAEGENLQQILTLASSAVEWLSLYLKDVYEKTPDPTVCMQDTARLVDSALSKQKWTVPFVDSAGKPGPSATLGWLNFVGNLDQCKAGEAPQILDAQTQSQRSFKGQYCIFKFSLVADPRVKPKFGVCVPNTCSDEELTSVTSQIMTKYKADGNITLVSAECILNETEVTTATVLAFILLAIVVCLAIAGTAYDLIYVQKQDESTQNGGFVTLNGSVTPAESTSIDIKSKSISYDTIAAAQTNGNTANHHTTTGTSRQSECYIHPVVSNLLLAFSVYTNGKKVLSTSQTDDSIGVLNGVRYISITWVLLGHMYLFGMNFAINIATEMDKYFDRLTYMAVSNSFASVDTFLAMSGLLTSYAIINKLGSKKSWKINWALYYFHRFWRLTPPYLAILLLSLGLSQYFGSGPMWANRQPFDKEHCEDSWWKNVLYINNFEHLFESCMPPSWYLANDMQFFLVSPLMTVPLFLHPTAGAISCTVFLLASWIVTGVVSTTNDWVTLPMARYNTPSESSEWMNDYYTRPWYRIGPYVVGIVAGFILSKTKGQSSPIKMKPWVVAGGWILSTICALSVIYGLHGDATGDNRSSTDIASLYNAVSRTVWGACVCWLIIACDAGYGGPVNAFLSWKPFIVLGRLTYMFYLTHVYIIGIFYQNMGLPFFMNNTTMAVFFSGVMAITTAVAFVFMLLFESPMIGLEKIFIKNQKKEQSAL